MEVPAVQTTRSAGNHYLETASLWMRAVENADANDYIDLLTDRQVMKYVGIQAGQILTLSEITYLVDRAVEAWETHGWGRWSIFEAASNEFVGFTGFRNEDGMPELISVVHERFWGLGYAYEASRCCIDYGFECLGFTQISAVSRPANARARSMAERLGGRFAGIFDYHGIEGAKYLIDRIAK